MFHFILHPLEWHVAEHGDLLFHARRLDDGYYVVTWDDHRGRVSVRYASGDVMYALASGKWIMTDEQGNL